MKFHFNISTLAVFSALWVAPAMGIEVAPETLDCDTAPRSSQPLGPETSEERTARLNMEFELSLQYFDRCIAKIAQDDYTGGGPKDAGGGGYGSSSGTQAGAEGGEQAEGGESGDGGESTSQAGAEATSGSNGDGAPELGQSASANQTVQGGGSGNVPSDVPGGDDDDIVAQQLRQAALETTDPVAREKLWDDYRKYKGID